MSSFKKTKDKYHYPMTKETINDLFAKVFSPLTMGQSVTISVAPHIGGGHAITRFMIRKVDELGKNNKMNISSNSHEFVYVNADDLVDGSNRSYLQLILRCLCDHSDKFDLSVDEMSNDKLVVKIREVLREIAKQKEIVLVLRAINFLEFSDEYLWGTIRSLQEDNEYGVSPENLHFLFVYYEDGPMIYGDERFERIHHLLLQNVVKLEEMSKEDVRYSIERWGHIFGVKFSGKEKRAITAISSRKCSLIKPACQVIALNSGLANPEDYLKNHPLFGGQPVAKKSLYIKDGEVLFQGKSIEPFFSATEYKILKKLTEAGGKIITKDSLAEIIWGKSSSEKYSEWAIAQTIKRIRSKLDEVGIGRSVIKTVRDKGYLLKKLS